MIHVQLAASKPLMELRKLKIRTPAFDLREILVS
jgi:hypothetical protein